MKKLIHPNKALYQNVDFPLIIPACEHFAGKEELMIKALKLQADKGGVFDLTLDAEDGAATGEELEHMRKIVALLNSGIDRSGRVGVRIHDFGSKYWKKEVDIILKGAGKKVAYITLPKVQSFLAARLMANYIKSTAKRYKLSRQIPLHILIETQSALREVWNIAALPGVETIDFGLWDFIADHNGAITREAMRSPGQFEHKLIVRAKSEIAAAALGNGVVPAHNVTLSLDNKEQVYSDAKQARNEYGFLRMWSIHPAQIDPIIEAMRPDFSRVSEACEVLLMAQRENWGAIRYNGEIHDRATYRSYWDLLQRAKIFKVELPKEARTFFSE